MDRSFTLFIILVVLLFISWIAFLILSTCLGPPLRQLISQAWSNLPWNTPTTTNNTNTNSSSNRHRSYHYQQLLPLQVEEFEMSSTADHHHHHHESVYK
ncbi:hypothetical protein PCANC_16456 [Puccinia coronata f. sp. avenae]|uniref:Uncharacterized protein n=1 Tax=Puccinia coronata f. sp. avenae TaxID=200324 RepID=A0A2N5UBK1_9BASI|nr:hypothetical protein PCANC_16456 [Puccinia coronata f. sp. avenae]PLW35119.1 hypothetical protein PCASD_12993 [Puccinia coronata f. sp. avenae]